MHQEPLKEREAAKRLGVSVSKLRSDRFYSRGVPYVKVNRAVVYLPADIDAYLQRHRVDPGVSR